VTFTPPPLLSLLGLILGGAVIGIVTFIVFASVALLFMASRVGSWAASLSIPAGVIGAVAGWLWLSGFL
jgi:hypothetical protein